MDFSGNRDPTSVPVFVTVCHSYSAQVALVAASSFTSNFSVTAKFEACGFIQERQVKISVDIRDMLSKVFDSLDKHITHEFRGDVF